VSSPLPARTGVSHTELKPCHCRIAAPQSPDRVAVVHGARRDTYGQLCKRVNCPASVLRDRGLERYDRVAALRPNAPAPLALHHGMPAAGGVLLAINIRLTADEIRYKFEHSDARLPFVDAELEPLVADPVASANRGSWSAIAWAAP
jgi:fatty-acyl-CoA synthase